MFDNFVNQGFLRSWALSAFVCVPGGLGHYLAEKTVQCTGLGLVDGTKKKNQQAFSLHQLLNIR